MDADEEPIHVVELPHGVMIEHRVHRLRRLSQNIIGLVEAGHFEFPSQLAEIKVLLAVVFDLPLLGEEEYEGDVCFHGEIDGDGVLFGPDQFVEEVVEGVLAFPELRRVMLGVR